MYTRWLCVVAALAVGEQHLGAAENVPRMPRTAGLLSAGSDEVRIVCFGDSITGLYYHSGGRRAYCDLLGMEMIRTVDCPADSRLGEVVGLPGCSAR